jgi:hypothetical protein
MKKAFTSYLTLLLLLSGRITAPLLHAGAAAGDCGIEFFNSGYIQTPDFHKLGITGEVTVEFWAKTAGPAGHFVFRLFPDDPANRFAGSINYGGADTTYWDVGDIGGNGRLAQDNPFPTAGKWVHYAMVSSKSGNFMRYYMNGELIAQNAEALEFFPNFNGSDGYALRIGPEMSGALDEYRIWKGVRTQTAIRTDMFRTLTGSESGLRLYYKFEEPTIGTVVNPGTILLTIVPIDEPLIAEVQVKNADSGFIFPTQKVRIKISTFPFQKYGMVDGEVTHVGADSSDTAGGRPEELNPESRLSVTSYYKAHIQLRDQRLKRDELEFKLLPGMQVIAEVRLGERTVLEYLLSPVQKAIKEAGRER